MPIADTKKVQSLIQGTLEFITDIEAADTYGQALITKYQDHNPNLAGSNLTTQQVLNAKSLINDLNTLLSDNSTIITVLKGKDMPSHGTKCLD